MFLNSQTRSIHLYLSLYSSLELASFFMLLFKKDCPFVVRELMRVVIKKIIKFFVILKLIFSSLIQLKDDKKKFSQESKIIEINKKIQRRLNRDSVRKPVYQSRKFFGDFFLKNVFEIKKKCFEKNFFKRRIVSQS